MSNIDDLEKQILSPMKLKYCQEYIKDGNGVRAATEAGYSPRSASQASTRLLRDNLIRAYIQALQAEARHDAIVSYEEISKILSSYIRREATDPAVDIKGNVHYVPVHSREIAKLADVYSKLHGWQQDNLHLQSDNTVQFVDDITDIKQSVRKQAKKDKTD